MTDEENHRDFPIVEAVEKVVRAPAKQPTLYFPERSISEAYSVEKENQVSPSQSSREVASVTSTSGVTIGKDAETGLPVTVTDKEREGGFYILGKPRTGKSNLLVSMALQDIENDHGVLFIDPHYEAINNLLERIPHARLKDVVYLDPTHKQRSFGINLLHCKDRKEPLELAATVGRVRDIFAKVWGDDRGELGIWLDKVITNSVYVLLENEGYTLADVPLLLWRDTTFRDSLLKNVTTTSVRDFWYKEFDALPERDKREQVGSTISRLDILMGSPILKEIVGQKESTIDFAEILESGKIVLLAIPANLDRSVKNIIGTIVISELLYEIFERAERLGKEEMPYFGIYCDEFQEFATPDFAKLFTQTGKFRVTPAVAHQTREQFRTRDDPNRGATAASPNKVFFTLSPYDANELPLVFTKEPPTETRFQEQYVISQNPVYDLLPGHNDPEICRFVNKYFRFLEDKREDIKADIEGVKFARMIDLDTAAVYGAEAQEEGIAGPTHYASQLAAVAERQSALLSARMHSINLVQLQKKSTSLRLTMRELNRFLTEVMKGERRAGQEAFSDFLISLAAGYSALPEAFAGVLGLYIKLSYGDNNDARAIPLELGGKITAFSGETASLTNEAAQLQWDKRSAFEKQYKDERWKYFYSERESARSRREVMKHVIAKAVARKFVGVSPWSVLEHWPEGEYGWGFAQIVAEHKGYGGISCVYFENCYFGGWYALDDFVPQVDYPNRCAIDFSKAGSAPLDALRRSDNARSYIDSANNRNDVVARKALLEKRWGYFSQARPAEARTWAALDVVTRWYLLMRSCDLVMYGREFADRSFPDPSNSELSRVVSSLVWLFEEHEAELIKKREDAEEVKEREKIERECANSVAKIVISPPAQLSPRVLNAAQIRSVRDACIEEIKQGPQVVYEMAATIDEFASFCVLLARPENHVKARTRQYIEKQVRERAEIDMVNEAARLLSAVEPYTAYVSLEKKEDGAGAWIGKVKMEKLAPVSEGALAAVRMVVEKRALEIGYVRSREEIREEIRKRQEPWRQRLRVEAPPTRIEEGKEAMSSKKQDSEPEEESAMPPTSVTQDLKEGGEDRRREDKEGKAEEEPREREDGLPPQVRVEAVERAEAPQTLIRLEERLKSEPGEAVQIPASLKTIMPIMPKGKTPASGYGYRGEVMALTESEFLRIYSDQYMRLKASGKSPDEIVREVTEIISEDIYLSEDGLALGVTFEDEPEGRTAVLTTRFYPRAGSEEIRK